MLRRRGVLGECDARMQGAAVAGLRAQPRTPQRAAQGAATAQGFILLRVLRASRADRPSGASPPRPPCLPGGHVAASPRTRPAAAARTTRAERTSSPAPPPPARAQARRLGLGRTGGLGLRFDGPGRLCPGRLLLHDRLGAHSGGFEVVLVGGGRSRLGELAPQLLGALVRRPCGGLSRTLETCEHGADRAHDERDQREFRDSSHSRHSLMTPGVGQADRRRYTRHASRFVRRR